MGGIFGGVGKTGLSVLMLFAGLVLVVFQGVRSQSSQGVETVFARLHDDDKVVGRVVPARLPFLRQTMRKRT